MKQKIGILLISDGFAGAENVVKNLITYFETKENLVLFVNNEIYDYFIYMKIKKYNLGNVFNNSLLDRFIRIKNIAKKIDYLIEKEKISLMNAHLEYSFFTLYFSKVKIPIILSLHGEETHNLSRKKKFFQNFIVKNLFNKSEKLISISKKTYECVPEEYKKKTTIIKNGVDSELFKQLETNQKEKTILFVGRYMDWKGIYEILNVAKQLPQYEFWFAGQGPLENLIKGDNIKNLGFKSSEELVKLYNQAGICVFPSHREAFGLTGLEAMSCGKAVIATPLGFSEYIENGKDGIIIPAKDEKALKEAIVKLMENAKLRKKLEKNARKKALKYGWEKVASQYYDLFEKVINENEKQRQRE